MNQDELRDQVVDTLRTIFDPEIPVNIYDMGLIYEIRVDEAAAVHIVMTLTSPTCPVAESLPPEIRNKVRDMEGVSDCTVELVWEPIWDRHMMSEAARLQLGFY